ncbi:Tuberin [Zancudomyces culisetae]|uniref:Tuberin n=1 Tax=Zancudomyces culisetae TaxID=1213189 RepID=A0A1R1PMU5_ZANCU|nr:Tuberin [Zancudomyces culisetae]|eukprot:OMH82243.1 Tuberin [Zancudomyces culisetae]
MNVHILEFVSALARYPDLCVNLVPEEYKILLLVALNYIKYANTNTNANKTLKTPSNLNAPISSNNEVNNSEMFEAGPTKQYHILDVEALNKELCMTCFDISESSSFFMENDIVSDEVSEHYVLVMAIQAIDILYIINRPESKFRLLDPMLRGLLVTNDDKNTISEINQISIDMLFRYLPMDNAQVVSETQDVNEADLGETSDHCWAQGFGAVVIRAQKSGRKAQIICHRPSGISSRVVDLPTLAKLYMNRSHNLSSKDFDDACKRLAGVDYPQPAAYIASSSDYLQPPLADVEMPADSLNRLLHGEFVPIPSRNKAIHFPIKISAYPSFVDDLISSYPRFVNIDRPMRLNITSPRVQRTLTTLRYSPSIDTHKIGVIYVGPKQSCESEILRNTHGSVAYWAFLRGLGTVSRLKNNKGYYGGLDTTGKNLDGKFCITWRDTVSHIVFHVASIMPNQGDDSHPQIQKKAHVGNDYVHIVFSESSRSYDFKTIDSQFNYVQILVTPSDISVPSTSKPDVEYLYWVRTQTSPNLPPIGPVMHPKLVSLSALPGLVRIAAIHANIFVQVYLAIKRQTPGEYVSNWRQRLRVYKRLRDGALSSSFSTPTSVSTPTIPPPSTTTTASSTISPLDSISTFNPESFSTTFAPLAPFASSSSSSSSLSPSRLSPQALDTYSISSTIPSTSSFSSTPIIDLVKSTPASPISFQNDSYFAPKSNQHPPIQSQSSMSSASSLRFSSLKSTRKHPSILKKDSLPTNTNTNTNTNTSTNRNRNTNTNTSASSNTNLNIPSFTSDSSSKQRSLSANTPYKSTTFKSIHSNSNQHHRQQSTDKIAKRHSSNSTKSAFTASTSPIPPSDLLSPIAETSIAPKNNDDFFPSSTNNNDDDDDDDDDDSNSGSGSRSGFVSPIDLFCLDGVDLDDPSITAAEIIDTISFKLGIGPSW